MMWANKLMTFLLGVASLLSVVGGGAVIWRGGELEEALLYLVLGTVLGFWANWRSWVSS